MLAYYYKAPAKCSQPGESTCSYDEDCHHSCPFGDISAERMVCTGPRSKKQFGMGVCKPAWSEIGDPCVVGPNACTPSSDGYNDLYCQQNQLVNPNAAPGFNQEWVGNGTCQRRTIASTEIGAHDWQPAVPASYWNGHLVRSGVDAANKPVHCTPTFVHHMQKQGLLSCDSQYEAKVNAKHLCNNVQNTACDSHGVTHISLYQ